MKKTKLLFVFSAVLALAALFITLNPFKWNIFPLIYGISDLVCALLIICFCIIGVITCLKSFSPAGAWGRVGLLAATAAMGVLCWLCMCHLYDKFAV